jgi:PilZ domain-containing protein
VSDFDDNSFLSDRNRRKAPRRPARGRVWADPGGLAPVVDCVVVDISEGGASLAAVAGTELPDAFRLQIDASQTLGEAEVVWRRGHAVGVKLAKESGPT